MPSSLASSPLISPLSSSSTLPFSASTANTFYSLTTVEGIVEALESCQKDSSMSELAEKAFLAIVSLVKNNKVLLLLLLLLLPLLLLLLLLLLLQMIIQLY